MDVAFIHFFYVTDNQVFTKEKVCFITNSQLCWLILQLILIWFSFWFGSDFCLSFEFLFNWFPLAGSDLVSSLCNSFLWTFLYSWCSYIPHTDQEYIIYNSDQQLRSGDWWNIILPCILPCKNIKLFFTCKN